MPKSANSPRRRPVPGYLHHKASGQARVRVDGRDIYLGPYDSAQSWERYYQIIAQTKLPGSIAQPSVKQAGAAITVTELIAEYWTWCQEYYVKNGKPSKHLYTIKQALRHLRCIHGSLPAGEFGPLAFQSLQHLLISPERCRNYVNDLCAEIKRAFKWAVARELVPASVVQGIATVPGLKRGRCKARETAPVPPVDDQTIEATLPFLPGVVADMVRLHRLVGCRPSELCLARPCELDCSSSVWTYIPAEHKTEHQGRPRRIFIGPKGQAILKSYLERPTDSFCFSPRESELQRKAEMRERRKSKVQPSQLDRSKPKPKREARDHYTKDSYNRAIKRAVAKANKERKAKLKVELGRAPSEQELKAVLLEPWSPNQLRHAAATEIRHHFGLEAAQTVLGHSEADVTQIYAERDWQKAAEVMEKIG